MKNALDKTRITRAVITRIEEERKPKSIHAKHVTGYEMPAKVMIRGKKDGYVPDIEVEYDKETTVYEIELQKEMQVDKWRTFSLYAKRFNGNFYLVVPDYLKEPIKKEIEEKEINAGVLYFATGS